MFVWDGVSMTPEPRFLTLCRRQFENGETYALGVVENVSTRSRGHLFASIREAWLNLPEDDNRFPDPEYLRKWALVRVGHCHVTEYALDSVPDAKKLATALRKADEYAVIQRGENVVLYATAKSIANSAVNAAEFQVIKTKVLDLIAPMARTTRAALEDHSRDGGAR